MDDRTLEGACAVPLEEQLRSVPKDAREMVEIGYCSHRNIPYGRMCHEAADDITELRAENARLTAQRDGAHADFERATQLLDKARERIAALESVPTSAEVAAMANYLDLHDKGSGDDLILDGATCKEAAAMLRSLSRQVAEKDAEIASLVAAFEQERTSLSYEIANAHGVAQACERRAEKADARIADAIDLLDGMEDYCSETGPNLAMRVMMALKGQA